MTDVFIRQKMGAQHQIQFNVTMSVNKEVDIGMAFQVVFGI